MYDFRLQSLRGLAALSVVFGHAALILDQTPFLVVQGAFFQANSAVVFFYVLSGYVLSGSLQRDSRFWSFAQRRCARLLPVMWASVLFGVSVCAYARGTPISGVNSWFNESFLNVDIGASAIFQNLFALSVTINGPIWSIQTELFMILLLPIMVPLIRKASPLSVAFGALAICALSDGCLLPYGLFHTAGFRVVSYTYCFYLGAAIPRLNEIGAINLWFRNRAALFCELVIFVAMYLFYRYDLFTLQTLLVIDGLISAHIIAYVVQSEENARWLLFRPLVWLGDISFSVYAYGQLVLVAVAFFLFTHLPANWWRTRSILFTETVLIATLGLLIPIAALSFRFIERPTMHLRFRAGEKRATVGTQARVEF